MSVLDLAFKRMAMLSTLQNQYNAQNKNFFGNNKNLGVLQSGRGGLPRDRGGLMGKGPRLPGKVTKYKSFVQAEMADTTKKVEQKPIVEKEEEEEGEDSSIQMDNLLRGDVASPFDSESEESSEEITEPAKEAPKK